VCLKFSTFGTVTIYVNFMELRILKDEN
jgi:hypothetical protein